MENSEKEYNEKLIAKGFEQECRKLSLQYAISFTGQGRTIEDIIADANIIYTWLVAK